MIPISMFLVKRGLSNACITPGSVESTLSGDVEAEMEGSQEQLLLRRTSAVLCNGIDWFQGLPGANICYVSTEYKSRLAFQASLGLF